LGFDADTALRPLGSGAYEGSLDAAWWTPRGPLGGYVMAIVLRALEHTVADAERMPRSVTMHFLRPPAAGPVTVATVVERTGRSLTTVTGRLEQHGKLMGIAVGAYSKPWEGPLLDDAPMPEVEPPDTGRPPRPTLGGGTPPPFIGRLTMQHRFGADAFTRAEHAEVGGWLGLREEREVDALVLAVLADAWFPAPWPRLKALAPAPTIDLTLHFRAPLPLADTLLLGRFRTRLVRDGFFEEDGELWSPDGTLVAQSRQLGLLIGAQA
jgi:acyl-CoA thioesterase